MDPTLLAVQAVGGFTIGALVGYAVRKATKWLLLLVGFMLMPVVGLWYLGVLDVNWEGLNALLAEFMQWLGVNLSDVTLSIASAGAFGLSSAIGFIFGITGGFAHNVFPVERTTRFVKRKKEEDE